jgi:hypothetical protein
VSTRRAADIWGVMAPPKLLVPIGAACLLLAGCGGAGGSAAAPSTASSASSSPTYVAAADAICSRQLGQLNKLPRPTTPEGALTYLPRALPIMRREVTALQTLKAPAREQAQFAAGLASARKLSTVLGGLLHKLHSGIVELSALTELQTQTEALRADLDAHFRSAGLAQCGE